MAREFCRNSTFGVDDLETHKAGAFGSRCGLAVDGSAKEIRIGKDRLFVRDGDTWRVSDEVAVKCPSLSGFSIEVKNGAAPLMGVLSAYAALHGDLEWEAVQALNNGLEAFPFNVIFTSHDHQLTQTVANRIIELTEDGFIDRMMTYDEYMHLYSEAEQV